MWVISEHNFRKLFAGAIKILPKPHTKKDPGLNTCMSGISVCLSTSSLMREGGGEAHHMMMTLTLIGADEWQDDDVDWKLTCSIGRIWQSGRERQPTFMWTCVIICLGVFGSGKKKLCVCVLLLACGGLAFAKFPRQDYVLGLRVWIKSRCGVSSSVLEASGHFRGNATIFLFTRVPEVESSSYIHCSYGK